MPINTTVTYNPVSSGAPYTPLMDHLIPTPKQEAGGIFKWSGKEVTDLSLVKKGDTYEIKQIHRGSNPLGSGGQMIKQGLDALGVSKPEKMTFEYVIEKDTVAKMKVDGAHPENTALGKTFRDCVARLGGTIKKWHCVFDTKGEIYRMTIEIEYAKGSTPPALVARCLSDAPAKFKMSAVMGGDTLKPGDFFAVDRGNGKYDLYQVGSGADKDYALRVRSNVSSIGKTTPKLGLNGGDYPPPSSGGGSSSGGSGGDKGGSGGDKGGKPGGTDPGKGGPGGTDPGKGGGPGGTNPGGGASAGDGKITYLAFNKDGTIYKYQLNTAGKLTPVGTPDTNYPSGQIRVLAMDLSKAPTSSDLSQWMKNEGNAANISRVSAREVCPAPGSGGNTSLPVTAMRHFNLQQAMMRDNVSVKDFFENYVGKDGKMRAPDGTMIKPSDWPQYVKDYFKYKVAKGHFNWFDLPEEVRTELGPRPKADPNAKLPEIPKPAVKGFNDRTGWNRLTKAEMAWLMSRSNHLPPNPEDINLGFPTETDKLMARTLLEGERDLLLREMENNKPTGDRLKYLQRRITHINYELACAPDAKTKGNAGLSAATKAESCTSKPNVPPPAANTPKRISIAGRMPFTRGFVIGTIVWHVGGKYAFNFVQSNRIKSLETQGMPTGYATWLVVTFGDFDHQDSTTGKWEDSVWYREIEDPKKPAWGEAAQKAKAQANAIMNAFIDDLAAGNTDIKARPNLNQWYKPFGAKAIAAAWDKAQERIAENDKLFKALQKAAEGRVEGIKKRSDIAMKYKSCTDSECLRNSILFVAACCVEIPKKMNVKRSYMNKEEIREYFDEIYEIMDGMDKSLNNLGKSLGPRFQLEMLQASIDGFPSRAQMFAIDALKDKIKNDPNCKCNICCKDPDCVCKEKKEEKKEEERKPIIIMPGLLPQIKEMGENNKKSGPFGPPPLPPLEGIIEYPRPPKKEPTPPTKPKNPILGPPPLPPLPPGKGPGLLPILR